MRRAVEEEKTKANALFSKQACSNSTPSILSIVIRWIRGFSVLAGALLSVWPGKVFPVLPAESFSVLPGETFSVLPGEIKDQYFGRRKPADCRIESRRKRPCGTRSRPPRPKPQTLNPKS